VSEFRVETLNTQPQNPSPPQTLNPKPLTSKPEPYTLNPIPQTLTPNHIYPPSPKLILDWDDGWYARRPKRDASSPTAPRAHRYL